MRFLNEIFRRFDAVVIQKVVINYIHTYPVLKDRYRQTLNLVWNAIKENVKRQSVVGARFNNLTIVRLSHLKTLDTMENCRTDVNEQESIQHFGNTLRNH